jgi:CIC family chloride channel protein
MATAEPTESPANDRRGLLLLGCLSLLVGGVVGLVGALFRLALTRADQVRTQLIAWGHDAPPGTIVLFVAACAAATAAAAWLVRKFSPQAAGSGIPHVECVLHGEVPPAPFWLVPVKFFGGLLAIGSGLALGREGPSVQMGATLGHLIGRAFGCKLPDCLVLLASGAGAGLATAFNAPIGGAVFVLEELARRFDLRITIATLGTSAGAIAVSRAFLGDQPDFRVAPLPYHGLDQVPIHLALGLVAGLLGVAYNRTILGTLSLTDRFPRWPVEWRGALIGALVGLIAWYGPDLVGGGDAITQNTLDGTGPLLWVLFVFLLRFGLGPLGYAARTPGGLFAPLLVLGAQIGFLFAVLAGWCLPGLAAGSQPLAVVGMAAFFSAVVRSPVTGIILVIEMTGCFTLLLPMLSACFAATLLPTLLGDPPIYDSLRIATLQAEKAGAEEARPTEPRPGN